MPSSEVQRVREVYARRARTIDAFRYTPFDPAHLLLHFSRQRAFLNLLKRRGIFSLAGLRVLEVGCGAADILIEYLNYGAKPSDLFGIDVLADELGRGHERAPTLRLFCADGQFLPFSDGSFDLVTQYTVFTSVLDMGLRRHLAVEILRVVAPGGLIVTYDFWPGNPDNPSVRGLIPREVKALFPNCHYDTQRIVLAPPIARRLAPISLLACQVLERIPWLSTHFLIGATPSRGSTAQPRPPTSIVSQKTQTDAMSVTIRPMLPDELSQVVKVHLQSFPRFFLTFLGPVFLKLFYNGIRDHPGGIVLVAASGQRIEGFVAGVTRQSDFYKHLVQQKKWAFALASLKALLKNPMIALRLIRALERPIDSLDSSAEACLMSIAVRPESEGKGIGRQLVYAFLAALTARGEDAVCLTTDRDHNERANRFYQQLGFRLSRSFVTPEGRAMNEYVIALA